MTATRLRYQDPGATMTLAEGLAEYRLCHPERSLEGAMPPRAAQIFHAHDLCQVVFGCNATIEQDAMADAWTLLGTDAGMWALWQYIRLPAARAARANAGMLRLLLGAARVLPRVVRHTRAMRRKWPFLGGRAYEHWPLDRIRASFGIRIVPHRG